MHMYKMYIRRCPFFRRYKSIALHICASSVCWRAKPPITTLWKFNFHLSLVNNVGWIVVRLFAFYYLKHRYSRHKHAFSVISSCGLKSELKCSCSIKSLKNLWETDICAQKLEKAEYDPRQPKHHFVWLYI